MLFRRIIFSAILIGIFSGLLLSASQIISVTPILLSAEQYEVVDEPMAGHEHHQQQDWAPEDGFERTAYTISANILAAIGFASIILVYMSHLKSRRLLKFGIAQGAIWGCVCFLVFFVIPSLGLPPEIPGSNAEALPNRQSWWLLSVCCAAVGLSILVFSPLKLKLLGVVSLALPFLVGAPHLQGPLFSHTDPQAVIALTDLHQQFIIATGISNFILWFAIAIPSLWLLDAWVYKRNRSETSATNDPS